MDSPLLLGYPLCQGATGQGPCSSYPGDDASRAVMRSLQATTDHFEN